MKCATARDNIRARIRLLYGSAAHLAALTGLTKQTLHARIIQAGMSDSHRTYFEFLLILPSGSLTNGTITPEQLETKANPSQIAYAITNADRAWVDRRWTLEQSKRTK